jgi:ABC-type transport system involved in multi-copper enzyme maturation permease subunit
MLWYKAWLETRSRFFVMFIGINFLFSVLVWHRERGAESWSGMVYYNDILHSSQGMLALVWVPAICMLMMGGLLRESASGAASFTLALPVSRNRLMGVRIGMGVLQAVALGVTPSCCMYAVAHFTGKAYSASQLGFHVLLLLSGGSVFFGLAVVVSSLIEGEYTAPAVALGIAIVMLMGLGEQQLKPFNPAEFMMGSAYLDRHSNLLVGVFPWQIACIWLALGVVLLFAAAKFIARRDF